jgi:hypothetical protein
MLTRRSLQELLTMKTRRYANRIKTAKKLVEYAREKIMLNLQLPKEIQRLAPLGMNMSFLRSPPFLTAHKVGHLSPDELNLVELNR